MRSKNRQTIHSTSLVYLHLVEYNGDCILSLKRKLHLTYATRMRRIARPGRLNVPKTYIIKTRYLQCGLLLRSCKSSISSLTLPFVLLQRSGSVEFTSMSSARLCPEMTSKIHSNQTVRIKTGCSKKSSCGLPKKVFQNGKASWDNSKP